MRFIIAVFVSLLFCTFGMSACASSLDDRYINQYAREAKINHYSITTVDEGMIQTISSHKNVPLVFEAGSISKPVTAYLCLMLVQDDKLSLDDPIITYLPQEWITDDVRMQNITVRQLLSHSAGFSSSYELGIDRKIYFEPGSRFSYSGVGYMYLQQVIEHVYGGPLEQAAQEYVFEPLGMEHSTLGKASTIPPFISTSSFVLYGIVPWCAVSVLIFGVGMLVSAITKFRLYSKKGLFYCSVAAGFVVEFVLLALVLPRLLLPILLFGGMGLIILLLVRKLRGGFFVPFLSYIIISVTLGVLLPISLPAGPEVVGKEPNAAYSLKTTSEDISLFAQVLLTSYHSDDSVMQELFKPQVGIDANNNWGIGLAIENTDDVLTHWHSGINPGMQSLFVLDVGADRAVVIMTNSDNGLAFAQEVAADYLDINGKWQVPRVDLP